MEEDCEGAVVVGGRTAGLATTLTLKRVGVQSLVLERSTELGATGAALMLLPNARGTVTDVATEAVRSVSRARAFDWAGMEFGSLHRSALMKALAEELQAKSTRFSSKVVSVSTETVQNSPIYVLHMDDGALIKAKVLVSALSALVTTGIQTKVHIHS